MANALFDIYSTSILDFTRTLVVKFSPTARAINTGLSFKGFQADPYDQRTWKYYMNLAGEYHEADAPMYIVSLDRPEDGEQLFTKTLLANNKLTRDLYVYGTRYYDELVERYPDQINLIQGIINPVDIDAAIDAEDGDILFFDETLVEENEDNLIPSLQRWIKAMLRRWFNEDYQRIENLYWSGWLAVLFSLMPGYIMSLRLGNCKTQFAHSHHIRQYLESHGRLGEFIPYLNKKQMLWLYRNIDYVRANSGHTSTFKDLVDIILTERGLPLSEFHLKQSAFNYRDDHFPEVFMERRPVSFTQSGAGSDTRTIESIVRKELENITTDEAEIQFQAEDVERIGSRGNKSNLPTKVLESAVIDKTDAVAFPLSEVLFYQWQYMAAVDDFRARINVTMPVGGQTLILTVREALYLWMYCISSIESIDVEEMYDQGPGPIIDKIPTGLVRNIRRPVPPTREELEAVVDTNAISEGAIDFALQTDYSYGIIYDTDTFYQECSLIQEELMRHYLLWSTRDGIDDRAQCAYMVSMFYFDMEIPFPETGDDYGDWLASKGIDFSGMTKSDYQALALRLVAEATGAGENASKSLRETHAAMIRLFTRLSSYSIQVLRTINNSEEIVMNTPPLRTDLTGGEKETADVVRIPYAGLEGAGKQSVVDLKAEGFVETGIIPVDHKTSETQVVDLFSGIVLESSQDRRTYNDVLIPAIDVIEQWDGVVDLDQMDIDDVQEYLYPQDPP